MTRRQTTSPRRWLIVTDADGIAMATRLPRGAGVLLLGAPLGAAGMRRLRVVAKNRGLTIVTERRRVAARVHNLAELRRAMLARTQLVMLSPMFETASHPDWRPIPRMRAAAMARLAGREVIALGGMDERRFGRVARLGFSGWAGISAFRI